MGMGRIGRKPIGFAVGLCVPAKVQLSVEPQASPQGEGFAWAAFCILCVNASNQNGTSSSGVVQITHDLQQDITGREIVVIEDILDSGNTLYFLKNYFLTKGAKSVTVVTLLDKPARRVKPITADLAGFEVPDEFVVGYGLDYAQQYRNMPYIGGLKPEVYSK